MLSFQTLNQVKLFSPYRLNVLWMSYLLARLYLILDAFT